MNGSTSDPEDETVGSESARSDASTVQDAAAADHAPGGPEIGSVPGPESATEPAGGASGSDQDQGDPAVDAGVEAAETEPAEQAAAVASEVAETTETETATAPQPEVAEAAQPEVAEAAPEVAEAAQSEVAEAAQPEVAEAAQPEVAEAPQPEVAEAAQPEVAEAAQPEVAEAPASVEVAEAQPEPEVAEAAPEVAKAPARGAPEVAEIPVVDVGSVVDAVAEAESAAAAPIVAAETSQAPSPSPQAPPTAGSAPATPPPAPPGGHTTPPGTAPTPDPSQPPVARPPVPKPKPVTETGRILEGVVTAVSSESVELTLDDGRSAVIHRRNFALKDEDPSAVVSVGDRAFGAELARDDPKSRVVLSRAWALKRQAWEKVVKAAEGQETLTGRVVSASSKGVVVDVGVRGFVPASHLELNPVADVSVYTDQSLELRVLEVDPRKEKLVLSRRSLLLKAQRKEMQELLSSLQPGEVRRGVVASLAEYGAFVDLGGVSGLVHISELSWQRVRRPADVVTVGDEVEVKILDVKPKKKRISLSLRQTGPDPLAGLEVGTVVTGRVTRLVDFGAFVAIGEAEGLVHLSELAEYRVISPEEVVTPGDEVGVKILSVDVKRRRIELSIRRAAEFGG